MSFLQDSTMASQAIAQIRQWSSSACMRHSAAHAIPMSMHAVIIDIIAVLSAPIGRIIIRIIVMATSAVFMHIEEQRIIMSPDAASAHIVAAISAAEQASMHSCIIAISMPISFFGMVCIMSIIMLMGGWLSLGGVTVTWIECYAVLRIGR
jgi:hypothetical protein